MATKVSGSEAWARDVLAGLGNRNPSPLQVSILTMLSKKEGVPSDNNNPLDIEQSTPNEWGPIGVANKTVKANEAKYGFPPGIWNSQGVVTYATYAQGVDSTIKFLQANHKKITDVLTSKDGPSALAIGEAFLSDGAWGNGLKKSTKERKAFWGDSAEIINWINANSRTPYGIGIQNVLDANAAAGNTQAAPTVQEAIKNNDAPAPGCASRPDVLGFDTVIGHQTILSACGAKALVGGLMVGIGVAIMAGGVAIIIKNADQRLGLSDIAKEVAKPTTTLSNRLFGRTKEAAPVTTTQPPKAPKTPAPKAPTKAEKESARRDAQLKEAQASIDQRARENRERFGVMTTAPRTAPAPAKKAPTPAKPKVETRVPRKEKKLRAKP